MVPGEVVGGELRRHAAPAAREARAENRQPAGRAPERAQQIRRQARQRQRQQHQRDRQVPAGFVCGARRRAQTRADHADDDRERRQVLAATRVLAEHAPPDVQEHQQTRRQRRLHHHQRRQQQRQHLQRPAEDRQARAHQPARPPQQAAHKRQAQVLLVRRVLRIERLQGDPYAVKGRGHHRRPDSQHQIDHVRQRSSHSRDSHRGCVRR